MADEGPSLPSNYVTILHLKERWLKQQQQSSKSDHIPHESDSVKPKHDSASASKIPNESVHPRTNRHRIINQLKPDVTPHDSTSKTPNGPDHHRKNHRQAINQTKPEVTVPDSASKTVVHVPDTHQTVEKQESNTDQCNPKSSKTKNNSKRRNPRFVTDQIPTGDSTTLTEPEPETEPVPEKKQHRNKGGRRNQNQEVREPKSKTLPVAPKLVDSPRNDSGGDGVVETVAAAKEINLTDVSQRTDRRLGNGRFNGGVAEPEPVPEKKQHHRNKGGRKTPPVAPKLDDSSRNDSGGDGVVETVTAVKEINVTDVSQRTDRRSGSGRFNGGVTEPEPVPEKKQHRNNNGGRRNQNREVPGLKSKTPVAPKLDDSSRNDSGSDGVVETVAAAVKQINFTDVSHRTDRRWDSGRFHGGPRTWTAKPAFGVKKEHTTTAIWVRKGESASN